MKSISYCIANYLGEQMGYGKDQLHFDKLTASEVREKVGDLTFVTATDGNHVVDGRPISEGYTVSHIDVRRGAGDIILLDAGRESLNN